MRIDDPSERALVDLLDAGVELIDPHAAYDDLIGHAEALPFHGRALHVLGLQRLIEAKAAAGGLCPHGGENPAGLGFATVGRDDFRSSLVSKV